MEPLQSNLSPFLDFFFLGLCLWFPHLDSGLVRGVVDGIKGTQNGVKVADSPVLQSFFLHWELGRQIRQIITGRFTSKLT